MEGTEPVTYLSNVPDPVGMPKISVSELGSLLRCTKKHDYAYRQGLTLMSPPSYLPKGNYLHTLMERFLLAHAVGREFDLDAESRAAQARLLQERGVTVLEPDRLEIDRLLDEWAKAVDMLDIEVLSAETADGTPTWAVELEFYVDVGWRSLESEPVLLHGILDGAVRQRSSGNVWVLEHKSAGRAWSLGQFQFAYQGPLMVHALQLLTGIEATGVQYNFFYPKRTEVKQVYTPADQRELLVAEIQQAVWLRDTGSVVRQPHWGCNDCWYKDICYAELVGTDGGHLRETKYVVDPAKVARFQEGEA